MEGVNVIADVSLTKADVVPNSSTKVDFHLNNLLASHLSNPDLTPQEIAEASTSSAAAAAIAAKAARATAHEKAAAAAKAVAAAKSALDLIASFPGRKSHGAAHLLQLRGLIPNSSPHINGQCEPLPISVREGLHAISKRVDFSDLGMVSDSDRPGGEGAKEGTRKRGRPKSK